MNRREVITLLGAAGAAWPVVARGQQNKLPIIGFLGGSTPAATGEWTAMFEKRLRELDWTEGKNIQIVYRWAEGRTERYTEIAAKFVQDKVAVIVTAGTEAVIAAK